MLVIPDGVRVKYLYSLITLLAVKVPPSVYRSSEKKTEYNFWYIVTHSEFHVGGVVVGCEWYPNQPDPSYIQYGTPSWVAIHTHTHTRPHPPSTTQILGATLIPRCHPNSPVPPSSPSTSPYNRCKVLIQGHVSMGVKTREIKRGEAGHSFCLGFTHDDLRNRG